MAASAATRTNSYPARSASSPFAWTTCPKIRTTPKPCWTTIRAPIFRATPSAATTTRSCAADSAGSRARSNSASEQFGYRVFVDSAPVLEKAIAEKAGLGWVGKHTNVINRSEGSWFFLGELYTDLPLPTDAAETSHCGTCVACIDVCPTDAIVAPYTLDARRCISYLTIESFDPIPEEFREAIGNRIYGCDDCQLFCPWNKFANRTTEPDFAPRHGLDDADLVDLFAWDEQTFLDKTEGSAIRRLGHERWLRNIAVALGNATTTPELVEALQARQHDDSPLVREHVEWALVRHANKETGDV